MATLTESLTLAQLISKKNAGELNKGATYDITDRGISLTAINATQFNPDGIRTMLCPADYAIYEDAYGNNWIGVWNSTRTPSINDLTIWGGLVWKNLTGVVGTKIDDIGLDLTNWQAIPKSSFTNHEYISMIFNVNYDVENDWVNKQWDNKGNMFGLSFIGNFNQFGDNNYNRVDLCDWNYELTGVIFQRNVCYFCFNNSCSSIYDNNIIGSIYNNSNTGEIGANTNKGNINDNSNAGDYGEIYWNSNAGQINNNSNIGGIGYNNNMGSISYNSNNGVIVNNNNSGGITNNSNAGAIDNNGNNGIIDTNTNNGIIEHNNNNGNIFCGSAVLDVKYNINNGNVLAYTAGVMTDTVVNKT